MLEVFNKRPHNLQAVWGDDVWPQRSRQLGIFIHSRHFPLGLSSWKIQPGSSQCLQQSHCQKQEQSPAMMGWQTRAEHSPEAMAGEGWEMPHVEHFRGCEVLLCRENSLGLTCTSPHTPQTPGQQLNMLISVIYNPLTARSASTTASWRTGIRVLLCQALFDVRD